MVERMAGRFQHARQQAADLDHVALGGAQIDIGNFGGFVVRRDHAATVFLLQLDDTADVVMVVMGDQDVRQRPAFAFQRLEDRAGLRGVDRGRRLGGGVVDQVTEIVGEAGEQADFGSHDISIVRIGQAH